MGTTLETTLKFLGGVDTAAISTAAHDVGAKARLLMTEAEKLAVKVVTRPSFSESFLPLGRHASPREPYVVCADAVFLRPDAITATPGMERAWSSLLNALDGTQALITRNTADGPTSRALARLNADAQHMRDVAREMRAFQAGEGAPIQVRELTHNIRHGEAAFSVVELADEMRGIKTHLDDTAALRAGTRTFVTNP